jgi:hypothetical protein
VLEPDPFCTSAFLPCVLPHPKNLNISLKLPLAAFEAIESASVSSQESPITPWLALPQAVAHMGRLRKLHVWLDHDDTCTWTTVNERAALSPLVSLCNSPHLQVSANLPKLHPKWETSDRHFTEYSNPPPLPIRRRYRQRHHGVEDENGGLKVVSRPDFPILYELAYWTYDEEEMQRQLAGEPSVPMDLREEELSLRNIERSEREEWKAGRDPINIFDDFMGCTLGTL